MSEQPSNSQEPSATTERREIKWDAIAAIIASLVGLLALIVAGYTAYIQRYTAHLQREQVQAQVWPRLEITESLAPDHPAVTVLNQGVGPAIVQSVQVLVAGKPVSDWDAYLQRVAAKSSAPVKTFTVTYMSRLNGDVLRPGEALDWIRFANPEEMRAFMSGGLNSQAEIRVCYASVLGQSWVLVARGMAPEITQLVSSCPKLPTRDEFSIPPIKSIFEGVQHERQPATSSS